MSSIVPIKKTQSVDVSSNSSINQQSCDKSDMNFESSDHKSANASLVNGALLTAGPTPPPSGTSSKSVPKKKPQIEQMFETFYQSPNGEFKPTFYNPFEVKHRRRTSRSQFKILERAFMENCKPSAVVRKALAQDLNMSARSIQVWFQNRRAKLKTMVKTGKMTEQQMMEYLQSQQTQQQGDESEAQDQQDSPSSFEDSSDETDPENVTPTDSQNGSFSVNRRSIPNEAKQQQQSTNPAPFVCTSEMMKLGNSYPNQVRNRSYSLPEIQRSPQLPFKQLQEALFGNPQPQQPQQQQNQQQQPSQQPRRQQPAAETNYYNTSLNAFQHYFRASNAAMNHVNSNCHNATNLFAAASGTVGQINVPQLNFAPLQQQMPTTNANAFEYQVDPNRFRPRSSSFAVGQRPSNTGNSVFSSSNEGNNYEMLSSIKEDSPISEYMSLPSSYETSQTHSGAYFNSGNDHESADLTNQINSLDLDYFMSANGGYHHHHHHHAQQPSYANYSSYSGSSSLTTSASQSPNSNENVSNDYMNELAFLPQPTNEILLSTLIDDEHFLH